MYKYKKKEILGIVTTLERAMDAISCGQVKKSEQIIDILTQCQQLAIEVGDDIEKREDEATQSIIFLLEEYCEQLYQLTFKLDEIVLSKNITDKIKQILSRVKVSIINTFPKDKIEVVFLPYKASMWDSLESIWTAANEDENCNAIVVPIPYFDKKPDGSLGERHYEGGDFPDYVPIVSWDQYSIEKNEPDTIYIHNPYDGCNTVTSVLPTFYARELRKYTKKLIYVPYFVLHEIEPSNQKAINNIKHFISIPGVLYADKVIVQSEKMKQIYVNEFIKFAKEMGLSGHFIERKQQEERILGMGSPKYDKLIFSENSSIPDEWNTKICSNGIRKKVIFFNTNVSLLLNNADMFLSNLERIEKIFSCYSDIYTIIWREHPLTYETIKSRRPELLSGYLQFKENFSTKDWVIIDDTPEWYQSINISDCYFGAGGSLCAIYLITKKPMMITDYHYPNGISDIDVSLERMFQTMNPKHYYNEKYKNSLDLFLGHQEEVAIYQKEILSFLPEIEEMKKQNIGKRIYEYFSEERETK